MPTIFTVEVNDVPDLGFTVVVRDRRERESPTAMSARDSAIRMVYDVEVSSVDDPNTRGFRTLAEVADYVHEQLTSEPVTSEVQERGASVNSSLRYVTEG